MKNRSTILFVFTACMLAATVSADTIEFAEKTLEVKVSARPFGTSLERFPTAEAMPPGGPTLDSDAGVDWYRTDDSTAYERDHAGRLLRYGFKEGQLVAVRVFTGLAIDPDKEKALRIRESLSRILSEFRKLPGEGWTRQDESLRVRYASYCHPGENIFAVILITPSEKE